MLLEAAWNDLFAAYAAKYPTEAAELKRRISGDLPADFVAKADAYIAEVNAKGETIATNPRCLMPVLLTPRLPILLVLLLLILPAAFQGLVMQTEPIMQTKLGNEKSKNTISSWSSSWRASLS